jgi:chaperone modulatory protein CbpM
MAPTVFSTNDSDDAGECIVVEQHVVFSLGTLCRASGAQPDQVLALVSEGLLQPLGPQPPEWRFGGAALPLTRRALRLARDLEMGWAGVAMVMDLLAEIERLQARLHCR